MSKKHTYEYVKEQIENNGYVLLSTEYKNAHEKLKLQCSEKHKFEIAYYHFQQGTRCSICFGAPKLTYDYVKTFIEKENYVLLSNEYKNNHTKLKLQCPKKHKFEMIYNSFQQGQRCPICVGNKRLTYEHVKKYIENENYFLLSTEYVNNNTKLTIKCDKGHIYNVTFNNFQHGDRCPICRKEKIKSIFDTNEYFSYRKKVDDLTKTNYRKYKHIINPDNLPRGLNKYHLDHKYSVYDGFVNNISPKIIASVDNLQILSEHDNLSKNRKSCILLEELIGYL